LPTRKRSFDKCRTGMEMEHANIQTPSVSGPCPRFLFHRLGSALSVRVSQLVFNSHTRTTENINHDNGFVFFFFSSQKDSQRSSRCRRGIYARSLVAISQSFAQISESSRSLVRIRGNTTTTIIIFIPTIKRQTTSRSFDFWRRQWS